MRKMFIQPNGIKPCKDIVVALLLPPPSVRDDAKAPLA